MPEYDWRCNECSAIVRVERAYSEYKRGPSSCPRCKSDSFELVILTAPSVTFDEPTVEKSPFPFRRRFGNEVVEFTSAKQQRRWMDENGYTLYDDVYEDSADGYRRDAQAPEPAPSAAAEELLSKMQYVDESSPLLEGMIEEQHGT